MDLNVEIKIAQYLQGVCTAMSVRNGSNLSVRHGCFWNEENPFHNLKVPSATARSLLQLVIVSQLVPFASGFSGFVCLSMCLH